MKVESPLPLNRPVDEPVEEWTEDACSLGHSHYRPPIPSRPMRVAALYRYPVKGFTPELRETLTVLPDGRIAGDRTLGFRFADTPESDDAWSSKRGMLVLMNTPGLARLNASFDDQTRRLRILHDDEVVADESIDDSGRASLAQSLAAFALDLA